MMHDVKMGKRTRKSFSRISEVLEMPDLIEVQKNSYYRFLKEDLKEVFHDISPIVDFSGKLVLEFVDYRIDLDKPKYSIEESKNRDVNYAAPLRVTVRLINRETGEVKQQEVFMGDFPIMTAKGTFIINGAERVIVSQLVRSPGVYYSETIDQSGKKLFGATIIPNRGAWLEFETDVNDNLFVRIDRTRKLPATVLLRALGYSTNGQILELFDNDDRIRMTLERDHTESESEALVEIYKRLRPGDPPTVENARTLLNSLFFDPKRYDFAKVGRYKINKKLGLDIDPAKKTVTHEDIIETVRYLLNLINGEEVALPRYNFKTGKREPGEILKVDPNSPIIIEGIHALNEKLTSSIPKYQKYKIFIAPQIEMNIDNHSPVSATDMRLIRRIVRDMAFRNCPAAETIKMWKSVRSGEFRWIYPHQEGADFVYNSSLSYELSVFRTIAMSSLKQIKVTDPEYLVANRLIKYIKYFRPLEDLSVIPCNSLIREFIGGSCYEL